MYLKQPVLGNPDFMLTVLWEWEALVLLVSVLGHAILGG